MKYLVCFTLLLFLEIAFLPSLACTAVTSSFPGISDQRSIESGSAGQKNTEQNTAWQDSVLFAEMQDKIRHYVSIDPDSAYLFFDQLYKAQIDNPELAWERGFYPILFDLTGRINLGYEKRSTLLTSIIRYAELHGDNYELMLTYRRLSHLSYHVSKLDEALVYQLKAQEVTRRPGMEPYTRILPYVSLAHIYKDRLEGAQYADTVLTLIQTDENLPPRALHWIYTHLGTFFESVNMQGDALRNFKKAYAILREHDELQIDPALYLGFGKVYFAEGQYETAEAYLRKAQVQLEYTFDMYPEIQMEIAEAMIELGKRTNQDDLVEEYALRIVSVGHYADYLKQMLLAHRTLYDLYQARGLQAQADVHLSQYFEVRDAFDIREKANETYLDVRALDLAQKRLEMGAMEADLKVQTQRVYTSRVILAGLLILTLVVCYSWHKQRRLANTLAIKNGQIEEYNGALVRINEQLVEARDKAEESDRIKSSILQNMSHEIRTPLTSILGYAEMMEDGERNMEIASQIQRGGRRLMNTLTSVMDLAHLESGVAMLNYRSFDMGAVVRKIMERLAPVALEKGLELSMDNVAEDLVEVVCDPSAVERIANNLIHNAIHFTKAGCISVRLYREDKNAVLSVSDTGIGMETWFLPFAFDPFRQESEGHARTHEGVGLGLAVTKHLVELMDGRISVSSQKGNGSVFMVTLPIAA